MEKFKVSGVGLDTSNLVSEVLEKNLGFKYLYTSISSNNDFLIKEAVDENTILVTGIDFLDEARTALEFHLQCLKRENVNLLLIPADKDIERYGKELRELMVDRVVENIGINRPKSLKDLQDVQKKLDTIGIKVEYISLDICPYNFDYSIVSYCESNKIQILGFNPFGGFKNSGCMIESFTSPYLLGFAATYSSIIFLSGRNLEASSGSKLYVESLIGKEVTPKYILRKTVKKLISGFGDVISCSLKINEGFIVPIDLPEYLYPFEDLKITFGKSVSETDLEFFNFDTTEIEDSIQNTFEYLKKPEDGEDLDFLSIIRPKILEHLKSVYYDLPIEQAKLGKNIFMISCPKVVTKKMPWYKRDKTEIKTDIYILYYKSDRFLFRRYNFANKKGQNSNN